MQELNGRFVADINGGVTEGGCIPDLDLFPLPLLFPLTYPIPSTQPREV